MEEIVNALQSIQQTLGEADGPFAARLGVTRQGWHRARTGQTRPGLRLLAGAVHAFPGLREQAIAAFLAAYCNRVAQDPQSVGNPGAEE